MIKREANFSKRARTRHCRQGAVGKNHSLEAGKELSAMNWSQETCLLDQSQTFGERSGLLCLASLSCKPRLYCGVVFVCFEIDEEVFR